ncbi:MAG: hypothetical protein AAFY76_02100 [Cyanobacteria bacterium J06649_11]
MEKENACGAKKKWSIRRCSPSEAHDSKDTTPKGAEGENDHIQFYRFASLVDLQKEVLSIG